MQAVWREELKQLEMNNLNLQANDSSLKGQASVILEAKPKWVLNLQFDKLNLENLLPPPPASATDNDPAQLGQNQGNRRVRLSRLISISRTITVCGASRRTFC